MVPLAGTGKLVNWKMHGAKYKTNKDRNLETEIASTLTTNRITALNLWPELPRDNLDQSLIMS